MLGGGGLFFDMPRSNKYLLELLVKIRWARKISKKVILLGVGIGPVHLERSKSKLRKVLNEVEMIIVKDIYSRDLLRQLRVTKPEIHTTADIGFLLEAAAPERISEIIRVERIPQTKSPRIGICLCGHHLEIPSLKDSIVEFCEYATGRLDAQVWFIPMQTGNGHDDRIGPRSIVSRLKRNDKVFLLEGEYSPQENMGLMRRTDVVLGERFHGVILSLNNNIPFFGISYMPKVETLFKEIGHEEWQIRLDKISPKALIDGFERIWGKRNELKEDI